MPGLLWVDCYVKGVRLRGGRQNTHTPGLTSYPI